jgi:AcrR family transcriptional regulator
MMKRDPEQTNVPSIRTPVQRRSRDKFERIFTATETLFATKGPQATSIQDIIEEAGCSVGAFYQRFPDREALVTAVFKRFEGTVNAEINKFFSAAPLINMPLTQLVEEVVNFVFRLYAQKNGLFHSLMLLLETSHVACQGNVGIISSAVTKFGAILAQRKAEFAHPDPLLAANITMRMLIGVLDTQPIFSDGTQEDGDVPLETIQAEMTQSIQSYLRIPQRST